MELKSLKFAFAAALVFLIVIAYFCYDLGCAANGIRPGTGDAMLSIAVASGLLTVLTAVNLSFLHLRKTLPKKPGKPAKTRKRHR